MNWITIIGRLTRDPELKVSKDGQEFLPFAVASNDSRKIGGEWKETTDYFDLVAFGKTAASISKYFGRGDGIIIKGEMHQSKYTDKDGNERVKMTCNVREFFFPPTKATRNNDAAPAYTDTTGEYDSASDLNSITAQDAPF